MINNKLNLSFYKGKTVLITGHTGFKGSWMCKILAEVGANVVGYALAPQEHSLFQLLHLSKDVRSVEGDVRNLQALFDVFQKNKPEIVIHMAAQPLVRESYKNPVYTYETNVMGTVNLLECVRLTKSVTSVVNVTTDKVYLNKEWEWGYRENDELNGFDPYSNSKSCVELVTSSYIRSFFHNTNVAVSTLRAGNVIGGGDFSVDRIIPDCIRAIQKGDNINVRNPFSIRPYEHVLEPVMVYLLVAQKQYEEKKYSGSYNVGPDEKNCLTTGDLVTLFCDRWNKKTGNQLTWSSQYDEGPHEAGCLKLDCSKLKKVFGWKPVWNIETCVEKVVDWTDIYLKKGNIEKCMMQQIEDFLDNTDLY